MVIELSFVISPTSDCEQIKRTRNEGLVPLPSSILIKINGHSLIY